MHEMCVYLYTDYVHCILLLYGLLSEIKVYYYYYLQQIIGCILPTAPPTRFPYTTFLQSGYVYFIQMAACVDALLIC